MVRDDGSSQLGVLRYSPGTGDHASSRTFRWPPWSFDRTQWEECPSKRFKKVAGRFMALGLSVLVGTVSWFDSVCRTCASVKKR